MISTLTGSPDSKVLSKWKPTYPVCSGMKVACTSAYNVASGTVIFVGYAGNTYTVTIQCNSDECLRYSNLKSCDVKVNDYLNIGDTIGQTREFVLFEYCSSWKGDSAQTVRTGTRTYYKHDPAEILEGSYVIESYKPINEVNGSLCNTITLTAAQLAEFGDNRGADKNVEF